MNQDEIDRQRALKRYQELYDRSPGLQAVSANREGNIQFLEKLFLKDKTLNVLEITEQEQWNWLHKSLLHIPNPDEWTGTPVNVIQFYIKNNVPVNAKDCYGMTPLHYAMRGKNADAAIALLEAGADPNIPNCENVIPLAMIGGMPERLEVLKLLLEKGGNANYKNGNNELSIVNSIKKHLGDEEEFIPVIKLLEQYSA